ncbi:MAG: hypothetical protein KatS3mg111_1997 [Pirellulaceae bacterium]|nr:MAG: hypothetical protein KatS3mg111_1997 [Pirellulaceae bacterium]
MVACRTLCRSCHPSTCCAEDVGSPARRTVCQFHRTASLNPIRRRPNSTTCHPVPHGQAARARAAVADQHPQLLRHNSHPTAARLCAYLPRASTARVTKHPISRGRSAAGQVDWTRGMAIISSLPVQTSFNPAAGRGPTLQRLANVSLTAVRLCTHLLRAWIARGLSARALPARALPARALPARITRDPPRGRVGGFGRTNPCIARAPLGIGRVGERFVWATFCITRDPPGGGWGGGMVSWFLGMVIPGFVSLAAGGWGNVGEPVRALLATLPRGRVGGQEAADASFASSCIVVFDRREGGRGQKYGPARLTGSFSPRGCRYANTLDSFDFVRRFSR